MRFSPFSFSTLYYPLFVSALFLFEHCILLWTRQYIVYIFEQIRWLFIIIQLYIYFHNYEIWKLDFTYNRYQAIAQTNFQSKSHTYLYVIIICIITLDVNQIYCYTVYHPYCFVSSTGLTIQLSSRFSFRTPTPKLSNQNQVFIWYNFLIGCLSEY